MSDVSDLERQADRAAAGGDFEAARKWLEQAAADGCSTVELFSKLSAIRRALGDTKGALESIEKALALSPLDFSALLARAMLLERLGDRRSGEAFMHAIAQCPSDEDIPQPMRAAVKHARERAGEYQKLYEQRLLAALPTGIDERHRRRLERFASNSSHRTRHYHQQPVTFHFPGLPEVEFHDREHFPFLAEIEAGTDRIREEYLRLVERKTAELVPYTQYPDHVPLAQWRELNNNPAWTAIHLLQNGAEVEANAPHCPETMRLLSKATQPRIAGASPNAMFSLLAPRTRIPPHTGVANVRLVAHLPLIVPPGCGFRVGATTREWRVGEAFVFDDTIEHEAWNDSDELRVVLIFDLWAPALDEMDRSGIEKLIAAAGVTFMGG